MKDARPSIKTESSATVQGAPIVSPFGFPVKLGTCLHCGLPKDFHKREGDMLVCHSPDSRPMPL